MKNEILLKLVEEIFAKVETFTLTESQYRVYQEIQEKHSLLVNSIVKNDDSQLKGLEQKSKK